MSQSLLTSAAPARPTLDLYAPIAVDLAEVERILGQTLKTPHRATTEMIKHVSHYRGKRLRPALLLLTARACGRVGPEQHVLGAVVEMIHTATLVHDDVLDGAAVRRHVPTVNTKWGTSNSVLLGDYLFTHAFHLCATLNDARACRLIGEATNRTCEGELQQGLESGNLSLSEADYYQIIDGKTAQLISCGCRLGALFSGAADEVVESLGRFGRWLGMAFQIADDVLDLVGEERLTGKSLGTDLQLQKLTLPLIHLLNQSPAAVSGRVRQILSSPNPHRREALRPCLAGSDALTHAQSRAEEFAGQARAELECLPPSPCRSILEALCDRAVHRDS